MKFDADAYWRAHGPYLAGPGAATPEHIAAEGQLRRLLPTLRPIASVLDVGCGRGRLAALLGDVLPEAEYNGVDVGLAQVEATRKVRPDGEVTESRIQDFRPGRGYDLVIASEVLMHIPPLDIQTVCYQLRSLARRWVVTVDWTEPIAGPVADWNWRYDYPELFGTMASATRLGLQTLYVFRP